jgi:uncharacterized membrane protein
VLPPGPLGATIPLDVSGDGQVIVGYAAENLGRVPHRPVRWSRATGFEELEFEEPIDSGEARATNWDGSVVIGQVSSASALREAFRWTAETGIVLLGAGTDSAPGAVSADGRTVAGTFGGESPARVFRWTEAASRPQDLGPFELNTFDTASAWVTDMDASGRIIVGDNAASGILASGVFHWEGGAYSAFSNDHAGPGPFITSDGQTVYWQGAAATGGQLLQRNAPGPATIVDTRLTNFELIGIDSDGSTILGNDEAGAGGGAHITIWTKEDGARPLWDVLTELGTDPRSLISAAWNTGACCISADGSVVVGSTSRSSATDDIRVWIARLSP